MKVGVQWSGRGKETRCLSSQNHSGDFRGGPVVGTSPSKARGPGLIPTQGTKSQHSSQPKKPKQNKSNIVTDSVNTLKTIPIKTDKPHAATSFYRWNSWAYGVKQLDQDHKASYLVAKSCLTLWDPVDCSTTGFPVPHYLPEFVQTHVHWVDDANHLILCHPFFLLPSIFPSIGVFSMSRIFISGGPSIGASASASAVRCMGRCKICFLTSRPMFFPLLYAQDICKPFKKRNRILHKFESPVKQII